MTNSINEMSQYVVMEGNIEKPYVNVLAEEVTKMINMGTDEGLVCIPVAKGDTYIIEVRDSKGVFVEYI